VDSGRCIACVSSALCRPSPIAGYVELAPVSPLIKVNPEPLVPAPDLAYLTVDLTPDTLELTTGVGPRVPTSLDSRFTHRIPIGLSS